MYNVIPPRAVLGNPCTGTSALALLAKAVFASGSRAARDELHATHKLGTSFSRADVLHALLRLSRSLATPSARRDGAARGPYRWRAVQLAPRTDRQLNPRRTTCERASE